jgi:subtilisin family serine protease
MAQDNDQSSTNEDVPRSDPNADQNGRDSSTPPPDQDVKGDGQDAPPPDSGQGGEDGSPSPDGQEGAGSPSPADPFLLGTGLSFDGLGTALFGGPSMETPLHLSATASLLDQAGLSLDEFSPLSLPSLGGHGPRVAVIPEDDTDEPPVPNPAPDFPFDIDEPFIRSQWAFYNSVAPGNDMNVIPVWDEFTGEGVIIGFVDDGVDYNHVELAPNYLSAYGYDAEWDLNDPFPATDEENHGTCTSSISVAARNDIGIVGVAYDASFSMTRVYSLIDGTDKYHTTLNKAYLHATYADVVNVSLGEGNFPDDSLYRDSLHALAENGRSGLGAVIVKSAGNERQDYEMLSQDQTTSYHDVIHVAATSQGGKFADFSTPGANVWVSAPGEGTIAADRPAPNGYNPNGDYEPNFDGTSASAPYVSGVAALMLEANPDLGYRDVQTILAATAKRTAEMTSETGMDREWDWQINGAEDWNGGGMHVSHDYGFGLVDALAAVRLAESWDHGAHTGANLQTSTQTLNPNAAFASGTTITSPVSVSDTIIVEHVAVSITISSDTPNPSGLRLTLASPDGTTSWLMDYNALIDWEGSSFTHTFNTSDTNVIGSSQHFGETSAGVWTLSATEIGTGNDRVLESWTLTLYGDTDDGNDLYVFTNEYGELASQDPSRAILSDVSGTDTINAAAVSSDSIIDLRDGYASTIDGAALTIQAGTVIENGHAGDGDDRLFGNGVDNELHGWRGDDYLAGHGGADELFGGTGIDTLLGGDGADLFRYDDTDEGRDQVMDFSHADDAFVFDYVQFGQSGAGTLAGDHFFTDTSSVDVGDDCFIFENSHLYYDADGTGSGDALLIAQVSGDAVQADDIVFV